MADVTNAVYDYCADGIDALERTVLQLDVLDASVKEKIQQGLHELYLQLLSHVDDSMSVFERLALSTTLHVPPELCTAQASTSAAAAQVAAPAGDDGSELDQQLEALRQKVQEVRQDNRQLQSQINHLDRQLCVAGDGSSYAPLSAAIGTNKENLMEDMTAISEAARKLRPLLDKAQQLKQEREPHPVVTIADVGAADLTARQQISSMGGTLEDLQQLLA